LIAGIGIGFTYYFNKQQFQANRQQVDRDMAYRNNQAEVSKTQAIGQLAPLLTGKDSSQAGLGILLVNELANDEILLRNLALELKDRGGAKAIITLYKTEQDPKKQQVYASILQELHVYEADPGETIEVVVEPQVPDKNLSVEFAGHKVRHKGGAFKIRLSRKANQTYYLKVNFPLPAGNPSPYFITFRGNQADVTKKDRFETNGTRAQFTIMFVVD
jgi:hypothetical protein